jgi:UDP-GlcNAc:undecaprenyl-phosphate GlcNAc-1-phosphate transferase
VDAAWLVYPVTFLWITGLTNAFNFMDGIDGLAGGTALLAAVFFCLITYLQGSHFVYIMSYTLIAGALGFLFYNFPPARIFMGDVGSAFLGFVFAVLAIIAARYDHAQTPLLVMPLLLFHFIYDTAFTFCRRLLRGEKVTEAHRSHLYQLFQRLGHSHLRVSLFYWGMGLLQGMAAVLMASSPTNDRRILFFLPFVAVQIVYSVWVVRQPGGLGSWQRSHEPAPRQHPGVASCSCAMA